MAGPRVPQYVEDWTRALEVGVPVSDSHGEIHLVALMDLECPACRRFHLGQMSDIAEEFPGLVATTYVHFPLQSHRFARLAAEASECAARQGHFREFVDALFAQQDSLGLKDWTAYGAEAGVSDMTAFEACLRGVGADFTDRVQQGRDLGDRLGLTATPTIMLNGWRFPFPPTTAELSAAIEALRTEGHDGWPD